MAEVHGEPKTLAGLLAQLRNQQRKREPQGRIVAWLLRVCAEHRLMIRHEKQVAQQHSRWRSVPSKVVKGALVVSDPARRSNDFNARVILSCDRQKTTRCQLCLECNGVVLDATNWHCLAVPQQAFNTLPDMSVVREFYANGMYDVLQAQNGTIVTLYNWKHPAKGRVWCLASSNGYDVSSLRWVGDQTYAEIVYGLLAPLVPNLRLSCDVLGPGDTRLEFDGRRPSYKYSYSFGFTDPVFHLLGDPPRVWHVVTKCLSTLQTVDHATSAAEINIPEEEGKLDNSRPLEGLLKQGSPMTAEHYYGIILRSRNPKATKLHSFLLFRSDMLTYLHEHVYHFEHAAMRITHKTRLDYILLRAFLAEDAQAQSIFCHFADRFREYQRLIDEIIAGSDDPRLRPTINYINRQKNKHNAIFDPKMIPVYLMLLSSAK